MLATCLFALAACNQTTPDPAATTEPNASADNAVAVEETATEAPAAPLDETATIENIELLMMESFPVQINAIIKGSTAAECIKVGEITQTRNEFVYELDVTTEKDESASCTPTTQTFEEIISLDVADLPAGSYTVRANGATQAFIFSADNSIQDEPTATPEPEPTAVPEPTIEPTAEPVEEPEANEADSAETDTEETTEAGDDTEETSTDDSAETEATAEPEAEETPAAVQLPNDPNCVDLVSFGADITVPDDTPFEIGDTFVKTWRIFNTGTCIWDESYALMFIEGDQMDAPDEVALTDRVASGDFIDVSVEMTAPTDLGIYRGDWQLRNPAGEPLGLDGRAGESLWLQIETVEANTLGSISGVVWADGCDQSAYTYGVSTELPPGCVENLNGTIRGDGVFDQSAEFGLRDVIMTLGTGECGDATTIDTIRTDSNGAYRFRGLGPDVYCVFIDVLEEGNFARLIPGTTSFPTPGRTGITITIEPGSSFDSINFGWDSEEVAVTEDS